VPYAPPPTSCRASTPRLHHDGGALLTDNVRDEQTTRPQGQHGRSHGETGVMQRPRYVKACTKAADRCPRGRHVSGGDSHGRIGPQGGREKWAITTSRKDMC
jgi:hypothetical protein